jgi:hypothetical protein
MKKTLALIAIAGLAAALPLSAMEIQRAGVYGGFNLSRIRGDADVTDFQKAKFGLWGGGYVRVSPFADTPGLTFEPQLSINCRGARWEETFDGDTFKASANLTYLDLAVPIKYAVMMGPESVIHPFFFAGPYVGFNLSAKTKTEFLGETDTQDIEDIRGTEFGLVFGAGLDFDMGWGSFFADVRYLLGLTSISKTEGINEKNGSLALTVGYSFLKPNARLAN